MWVVKIGGSLSHDPSLREWLTQLWEVGGGRVVIVPGGGDFADTVRQYQNEWRFCDLSAHNMCLLAMAEDAILMQGGLAELVVALNQVCLSPAFRAGPLAVLVPTPLIPRTPSYVTNSCT